MEQMEFLRTVFEIAVRMRLIYISGSSNEVVMSMPVPIKEELDKAIATFEDLEAIYVPSKEVILYCAESEFNRDTSVYKQLKLEVV